MRQLLTLLLFIGGIGIGLGLEPGLTPASASLLLTGVGGAGGGGGGFVGPGNVLSGSVAWYGLRAYNAAVATAQIPAVNVRNTGTNETCDIKLATTGALSTTVASCSGASSGTAIATFCTGGCTATKLYDQSGALACGGAACDMSQATAANQPTFTLACPSLPCLTYAGGTMGLASATTYAGAAQPYTFSWVAERTGAFTANNTTFSASNGTTQIGFGNGANTVYVYSGATEPLATAADNAYHAIQSVFNNTSSIINVDGTPNTVAPGAGAISATSAFATGNSITFNPLTGTLKEVGYWASAFTAPQQASMCANQAAYWGLSACATYTGPGDLVPGATAWYGLRAYSAAAATAQLPSVNLRNTSTAETCDIKLATTGGLSTTVSTCSGASTGATIATFCSGGCTAAEIYDQTGNANHLLQATAAQQPTFTASCLSAKPCLSFASSSNQFLTATGLTLIAQPNFMSIVGQRASGATQQTMFAGSATGNEEIAYFTTAASTGAIFAGLSVTETASDGVWHNFQTEFNNASAAYNIDGTDFTGLNAGTQTFAGTYWIGADFNGDPLNGLIAEAGVWSALTSTPTQRSNLCHNQFAYWGTATSC